ncbi:MAG: cation transporter [Desulfatitalea sp.]|nr:cation transporter [Desulfatitalea sp.]NNK00660.1 cation transporter [Desulfatitalea sp.]
MNQQFRIEEMALKRSMVGAFLLAVWGIAMAVASHSGAVLLDGMYNLISAIMTFFSIEITRLVYGKTTREFPLGYFAFESLFVFVKGAAILGVVLMAVYDNIMVLLGGGREPALGLMTLYVAVAVIGCVLAYVVTKKSAGQTDSDILVAETKAWRLNAVVTGAIGTAFIIVMLIQRTPLGWIDRYVDQVLVILMTLLFIKDPLALMRNGLRELLLAAPQEAFSKPFINAVVPLKEALGARELSLEILKTGRRMWVTVFMDPAHDTISVDQFMAAKERLRDVAEKIHPNTQIELILHR